MPFVLAVQTVQESWSARRTVLEVRGEGQIYRNVRCGATPGERSGGPSCGLGSKREGRSSFVEPSKGCRVPDCNESNNHAEDPED